MSWWRSAVLEVDQELGVEDRVAVLLVVDLEESDNGSDSDEEDDDGDPDGGLLARDGARVRQLVLHRLRVGDIGALSAD